jgi:C-terminal processing protease CtpA/Prc
MFKPFLLLAAIALPLQGSLTSDVKSQTIDSLETSLRARYVFPETADKAIKNIRVHQKMGDYDKVGDGADFAKLLTAHLNEICKDAHLRVRYSDQTLPERKDRYEPSKAEIEAQNRFVRLSNAQFEKVERMVGNIGYLKFNGFQEPSDMERPVKAAFEFLADTDALIIDLRQNGGGSPEGVRLICSYLFDDKPVHLNDLYFREGNSTTEFWTLKKVAGKRYLNKDVYLLIGKRTGSGAEEFAYDLKNLHRATLFGENTWGGANPGGMARLNDHFGVFIPVGRAINPYTKTNWEGTGVDPDVRIDPADALKQAHVRAIEKLLAAAKSDDDKKRLTDALEAAKSGVTQ